MKIASVSAVLLLIGATALAAPKRAREIDHFRVHPNLASIRLTAVALLPAVSFDGTIPPERHAEAELLRTIREAGYRWIAAPTSRDMLRRAGGDSLLKAIREDLLTHDRLDSLKAGRICAMLRVNGLLTMRVDRAEQIHIQSDQTGRPSTTVQFRAALVDSLGRLVWSAAGSEIVEGIEVQAASAGAGTLGSSGLGGLAPSSTSERKNAPDWLLAYQPMFLRWAPTFPKREQMAGGAPPATPAGGTAASTPADSAKR